LTRERAVRERHVWIAVTAVLATSLAWLTVVSLAVATGACTRHFPEALAVLRALPRVALAVGRLGGPAALAALAGAVILIAVVLDPGRRPERRAHHA
jgi:hypothetical protein